MDKTQQLVLSLAFVLALTSFASAFSVQNARIFNLPIAETLPEFEPRDVPSGRISGGELVGSGEIPYAAGIIVQVPTGSRWCGGSLISRFFVLTTGSCFVNGPASATALLGASNMTDVLEIIPATTLFMHMEYDPQTAQNDIAMLRLEREVQVGLLIRPVRLPNWRQLQSPFTGQLGTVSGWGALWQNAPEILPLNELRRINLPVIANTACMLRFPGSITNNQICVDTVIGSPCQGDQGGPLTVADPDGNTTQIGIFSYVSMLGCNSGWPAVFTRITPYLPWIEFHSDVVIQEDFEF